MNGDNFMWFPDNSGWSDVDGETTDSYFTKKRAFEVNRFQFTMDNKESVDSGAKGSVAGRAKFQEFEVEKLVDSASVPLYRACSLGTLIPTIMLVSRKSGGSGLLYLQYIFRYTHVTGITWMGGEDAVTEKMTFSFKAMGFQYIAQTATGGQGKKQAWSWNTVTQGDKPGSTSLDISGIEKAPDFLPGRP